MMKWWNFILLRSEMSLSIISAYFLYILGLSTQTGINKSMFTTQTHESLQNTLKVNECFFKSENDVRQLIIYFIWKIHTYFFYHFVSFFETCSIKST